MIDTLPGLLRILKPFGVSLAMHIQIIILFYVYSAGVHQDSLPSYKQCSEKFVEISMIIFMNSENVFVSPC